MSTNSFLPPPPGNTPARGAVMSADKAAAMTRRASMLLLVLGGLVLVVSAICFLALMVDPQKFIEQMMENAPGAVREQWSHENLSLILHVEWTIVGVIALFMGLSLVLSAGPVRRGRRGAIIYAMIIVILCALACGLFLLAGVVLVLVGLVGAIADILLAACVLAGFIACLLSLFGSYIAANTAILNQRLALQSLSYPPGYASGYGAQVRRSGSAMTIEDSTADSAPQTT